MPHKHLLTGEHTENHRHSKSPSKNLKRNKKLFFVQRPLVFLPFVFFKQTKKAFFPGVQKRSSLQERTAVDREAHGLLAGPRDFHFAKLGGAVVEGIGHSAEEDKGFL